MSLLTLVQDAAAEVGLPPPGTVIGNGDPIVVRLLRQANRVGAELVERGLWQVLRTELTFAAVPGQLQAATVPSDVAMILPETMWDRTNQRLISGPVSPQQWQSMQATLPTDVFARSFTVRGNALLFVPGMAGGETLAFEYQSRAFCASIGGTPQVRWQADSDAGRLPEELITLGVAAYWLRAQGLPFEMMMAEYERRLAREIANDAPTSGILAAGDIFAGRRAWGGTPAADGGADWWR